MIKNEQQKSLTYTDYKNLYKSLKGKRDAHKKSFKIAILSSFTTYGLDEILLVKCYQQGIGAKIYLSPYNQYHQEILDQNSKLYRFDPNLVVLMIDSISFLGDYMLNPYSLTKGKRKKYIKTKLLEISELISKLRNNSKAKILLHNFNIPNYSPVGILENKQQFSFHESIQFFNDNLKQICTGDPNLFIFDYNLFCSRIGNKNSLDYKMYYLADMRLPTGYLIELCDKYLGYIKPLVSIIKKCIVLDLDNTLWGGILGEDGFAGIQLGPTTEGRSYWEFQKYLLSLQQRGILLAINSRNNIEEILNVLRNHPYMVLREEHFAAIEANWHDKVANMKSIAQVLNIGLDSFVFFDDDPFNRDLVRENLKEITVVDLPEDKSLYLDTLVNLDDFNTLQITEEDKSRGKMYLWERKRQELEKSVSNIDEFVKNLRVTIEIQSANEFNTPRISQLTQKTNQFNMTTRRYLEEDIKQFSAGNKHLVLSAKVIDKFGDYGLTGVVIILKQDAAWVIDTFLLSCRVLGRKVENSILAYLIGEAKKNNVQKLVGQFIKTEKNAPAENFYKNNNFQYINKSSDLELWEFDCKSGYQPPPYIKIKNVNQEYEKIKENSF